jgi:hypothetical protein
LLPNQLYQFRLVVTGGANNGTSNVIEVKTNAVLVTTFANTAKTGDSATFKWTAVTGASSVIIEQSTDNGATWNTSTTGSIATTATTAIVSDLTSSTNYKFRLVVAGGANEGASNIINILI